jgi:hypothetical protein
MRSPSGSLALALALWLPLVSCASIITGSSDDVTVNSSPQGALFTTNTAHSGTTPTKITIPDDVELQVHYSLAGYQDADASLDARMSAWLFGNILIGGLIGIAIDLITGNYKTHNSEVTATLRPVSG